MKRVLISPATFRISDNRYGKTYNLIRNLQHDNFEIDVVVGRNDSDITSDCVRIRELNSSSKVGYYTGAFYETAKILHNNAVDLYHHMNLSYRWFNPVLLSGLHNETPVVIGPCQAGHAIMEEEFQALLSHGIGVDVPRAISNPIYDVIWGIRDRLLDPPRLEAFIETLQRADKVVVVHEEAREQYRSFVDESKLEVIPLGVDPTEFQFLERSESTEFVSIGALKERKGYDVLIKALAEVSNHSPEVHLHIFGEGPLEEELQSQAETLGVSDNITFHGYVDQSVLRNHLGRARAFIHPSRSESFSLVRLEAMATGCPPIVTDISGAREMVRDGKEGYVVPIESHSAIAEAMSTLLDDFELVATMGRNARRRVEERYDWRLIADQYIRIYDELI